MPQVVSVMMTGEGECTLTFSKPMMYPKNWVNKFLKDNRVHDIRKELVDTIQVATLKFWF